MANEEQRRAFASYMGVSAPAAGTGTAQAQSQGQPVPQYPGAVAQPAHPFLYNQFPGLGVPPAAPTPPPAAASSVASFPSQGSFPAGFAQGQGAFGQHGLPQRPGPLGQAQSQYHQQQHTQQPGAQGYQQHPSYFTSQQQPPPPGLNTGWQQLDQNAELARRLSGAPQGAMVRNAPHEVMESHLRQTDNYYHYQQRGQRTPMDAQPQPQQVEETAVPVMLCHTCSECGQMRSAGYHRNNPVLPGKTLVLSACRRCRKNIKRGRYDHSSFARIRSCTADKPCDWPGEPVYADIDEHERRGRRRSRGEHYIMEYSPRRPRVIKRTSSQAHLGLGALQQPPRDHTYERRVRVSSLSPHRAPRAGEVWPPPDIVQMRASRSEQVFSAPPEPLLKNASKPDEVWPPPDIVRTHSFRTTERSASHRRSNRIVELSPSPPPARERATRVVYTDESHERRTRSRSRTPVRARDYEQRRSEDAQARMTAHPRPFRAVSVSRHTILRSSDETSSNHDSVPRSRPDSPSRSILKPAGIERVMDGRRVSAYEPRQSTNADFGGPRVHFNAQKMDDVPVERGRTRRVDEQVKTGDVYEHFREYSRHRVIDKSPPAATPPVQDFERLRVRRHSVSPGRDAAEEIRIDRARRLSPSPPPTRHFEEEIRIRHTSPLPRGRRDLRSPPTPEQPPYPEYKHVARPRHVERARSLTPPPARRRLKAEAEDVTDSDSAHSGEVTEVRSWRGLDENGRPATFVEERRQVRMIEQGNERGGEFRPLMERVAARSWRDV